MSYRIGTVLHASYTEAWVFNLPGCSVGAPDPSALAELLPVAIAEHQSWLARHGETVDDQGEVEVVEEVDPAETEAADGEFCFKDDWRPVSDEEIEEAIRWIRYARDDLLALIEPLSGPVLDWRPPKSAMEKIDPWNPGVRTIREIVREIAGAEGYYRTGLGDDAVPLREDQARNLALQRERTVERLRGLRDDERSRAFLVTRSWQDRPEHWTARKALRRMVSHERFHTKEIEQRLAWLLLGVPDFETSRTRAERQGAALNG